MDTIEYMFLTLSSIIIVIYAGEPTLDEVNAIKCNSSKPFKCLPYGICYNADEFCKSGTNESCFPTNVTTDHLENWCKTTGQFRPELMRDPKLCALACLARFPSLNLSNEPSMNEVNAIKCNSSKPFKCLPYGICYNADEFCHAGIAESCFLTNVTTDQLENWCKTTGQFRPELMRDPKLCALACQARFPSLNLYNGRERKSNSLYEQEIPLNQNPIDETASIEMTRRINEASNDPSPSTDLPTSTSPPALNDPLGSTDLPGSTDPPASTSPSLC